MRKPSLWLHSLGMLGTSTLADVALAHLGFLQSRLWLATAAGLTLGFVISGVWMRLYRLRMRRYLREPWEFDCPECGRHIVRFNRFDERRTCSECQAIPGWYRNPQLVSLFDPLWVGREQEIEPVTQRRQQDGNQQ